MEKLVSKSKVAICENCQCFVLACATDHLSKSTEKEFTEFTNMGFTVKIESKDETRRRGYSYWENCKNNVCEKKSS